PYNCIGKNLALTELRTLTARLVLEFDVKLASEQNAIIHTTDHFTVDVGDLNLVFTKALLFGCAVIWMIQFIGTAPILFHDHVKSLRASDTSPTIVCDRHQELIW
ncbi:hypothetical protein LTS12_027206, partial [Elasticomyces elasticus]